MLDKCLGWKTSSSGKPSQVALGPDNFLGYTEPQGPELYLQGAHRLTQSHPMGFDNATLREGVSHTGPQSAGFHLHERPPMANPQGGKVEERLLTAGRGDGCEGS